MDGGEPIRVWLVDGVRRVQRWHHNPADPHRQRWVTLGVLGDRRWFVEFTGGASLECRAYESETQARDVVAKLMAALGPFEEIPAVYDARGRPLNGPWQKVGTGWRRPNGAA